MKKAIFWVLCTIVVFPVFAGLSSESISWAVFAVVYGSAWWAFFTRTKVGRRLYRMGYRIASSIMGDVDV